MADKTISALTTLTTPADGDVLPIVDISDTTDGASGTTKKIAMSSIFPSSSTDNAIVRFDGTTGKLLQDSGLRILDRSDGGTGTYTVYVQPITAGDQLTLSAASGSTGKGADAYLFGGNATTGNNEGGSTVCGSGGGAGYGSGKGGSFICSGGPGGATGAGGAAIVQGGAGGATSGNGADAIFRGGSATNGDSNGGSCTTAPGVGHGSGVNGTIAWSQYVGAPYYINFDLSLIASSNKTFTFPNESGTFQLKNNSFVTKPGFGGTPTGNYFDINWSANTPDLWVDTTKIGTIGIVRTKTDTGDPSGVEGQFLINTFDNKFKVYADGAWRQLATW